MSRGLSSTNSSEVEKASVYEVILVKLEFDTPIYVHSGVGTITYDSNDYLGVGQYGGISNTTESESLRPTSLTLTLSGVASSTAGTPAFDDDAFASGAFSSEAFATGSSTSLIGEALDAGNYGDVVTIYCGYRQDDGALVDDPWVLWRGKYEYASINEGAQNVISITVQHDLAVLAEKDGSRFSDEDQQARFAGDLGFEFVADMANVKLQWGGRIIGGGGIVRDPRHNNDGWWENYDTWDLR